MRLGENKSFIIYSPEYSEQWGGVLVLHKLAKILAEKHNVYITSTKTLNNSKAQLIDTISAKRLIDLENLIDNEIEYIVVYPEVVFGNPLNAKKVIRWILYNPGLNGGDVQFNESELIFTYSKYFVKDTQYKDAPVLFTFESKVDLFFDKGEERVTNCYMIKKGANKYPQINQLYKHIQQGVRLDNILNQSGLDNNLNNIFNQSEYFLSYDSASYHSLQAAMSGCVSIVVPDEGVTKEEWVEKLPIMKWGVAWGIEDIEWAERTKHLVKDYLIELEIESYKSVEQMLKQVL
jgi:hypothetical protein